MVLYHNRVKNKFAPNRIKSTMTKSKHTTTSSQSTNETKYVSGSGVGAHSPSIRSILNKKASSNCNHC